LFKNPSKETNNVLNDEKKSKKKIGKKEIEKMDKLFIMKNYGSWRKGFLTRSKEIKWKDIHDVESEFYPDSEQAEKLINEFEFLKTSFERGHFMFRKTINDFKHKRIGETIYIITKAKSRLNIE